MDDFFYTLNQEEWQTCIDFVQKAGDSHSDNANHSQEVRDEGTKKRCILMGKTGEIAFAHLANAHGIPLEANFQDQIISDVSDFIINGKAVEVKTNKSNGEYLMIEPKNLQQHLFLGHPFPSAFVLALNSWNFDKDQPTRQVMLAGFIYACDLFDLRNTSLFLRAGEKIPNKDTVLRQDNFLVPLSKLRQDWGDFFQFLRD